jgi:hypothetical protein
MSSQHILFSSHSVSVKYTFLVPAPSKYDSGTRIIHVFTFQGPTRCGSRSDDHDETVGDAGRWLGEPFSAQQFQTLRVEVKSRDAEMSHVFVFFKFVIHYVNIELSASSSCIYTRPLINIDIVRVFVVTKVSKHKENAHVSRAYARCVVCVQSNSSRYRTNSSFGSRVGISKPQHLACDDGYCQSASSAQFPRPCQ